MKTDTNVTSNFALPEAAFEKYADMIYRLIFVRTKSRADSDDVLQEVFLRYMRISGNMQSEEHVKATLIRIALNCSNSLTASFWHKKIDPLDEGLISPDTPDGTNLLSEVLALPLKYRTVIHLHYYGGFSVEELAEITGSNPSTVKTRLSRGRALLRKALGEDMP